VKEFVYARFLLPAVERLGSTPCVHDGGYHATFAEHGRRVLRLRQALELELGLGPGDRFAVLSPNSHQVLELYHAALLGGGIITPLNVRMAPGELAHILDHAGARVVFVDERLAPLYDAVAAAGSDGDRPTGAGARLRGDASPGPGGGAAARRVVRILPSAGIGTATPARPDGGGPEPAGWRETAAAYEDLIDAGEPGTPPEPDEDDPVALIYTGGTTGLPRGALFTNRSLLLYMYHAGLAGGVAFRPGSVFLHAAPMFHSTTIAPVLSAPAFGMTSVIDARFEPEGCLESIETYAVAETILVPTMLQMMFDHERFAPERIASLRRLGYGGMPMTPALLDRLMTILPGVELVQGYGMTEAGALTVLGPSDHGRRELLTSVGRAVPGVVLSIQDPNGTVLGPGQVGEVCAQGGNLMAGYWADPDATSEALRGGWYHTGDAGQLDGEGYLFLADRLRDMIVTGGENVFSLEVENAIASHPAVLQVAVIGVPHERWGEQVHAVVVVRPGASLSAEDVVAHARRSLAGYKVPKSVELRSDPLPLSAAMKPLKRELRRTPDADG